MDSKNKQRILLAGIIVLLVLNAVMISGSPLGGAILTWVRSIGSVQTTAETTEPATEAQDLETAVTEPPVETMTAEPEVTEEPELGYPTRPQKSDDGTVYNAIPYVNQEDYPDSPYGTGSIATSGCTMTALSMAASYLTGQEVLPDDLARRYVKASGSMVQRMESASIVMDLKFRTTMSFPETMDALKKGKVILALMNPGSTFSDCQHMLVLRGMTADGRVFIHDPLGSNYSREDLTEGFEKGFPQETILQGFSGAWIYEFYEPPVIGPTNYGDIHLTQDEKDLLARLIWREARGESIEGQQAVAEVVFNRMLSDRFPTDTLRGTVMAEGQFRSRDFLNDTTADELQYKAIDRALAGPNILPIDVYYFATYQTNGNVWGTIGNHIFCGAVR